MPKVSVIVPNYNHARFLDRRLQSILNQTYQDFEVLFLDDLSTDDSLAVFSKYAGDPRVRLIQNTVNSGSPFKQWNKGVREAKGEYVWLAESDDYAELYLLEALVSELEEHPNVGLAYCQSMAVDVDEVPLYSMEEKTLDLDAARWKNNFINTGCDECRNYLVIRNTIPNASAVVFRKELYELVNGADENYRTCADWVLWAEMLSHSDVAFVAQILNFFRQSPTSVIHKNHNSLLAPLESYKAVNSIKCLVPPAAKSHQLTCHYLQLCWFNQMHGRRRVIKQWKEHAHIYRFARQVDQSINRRLFRKFFDCVVLGR